MGKFIKKSKITADFGVMDASPQYSLGVRTRAKTKTFALQRLQSPPEIPGVSPFSYLQLRSRRLQKLPPPISTLPRNQNHQLEIGSRSVAGEICEMTPDLKTAVSRRRLRSGGSVSIGRDLGIEGSLGESDLGFEGKNRSARESTPCSFIRDPDTIGNPGRLQSDAQRDIPTSLEMEEFFACAEQKQQKLFIEKYNFDIVNDLPLSGRYDWVQFNP